MGNWTRQEEKSQNTLYYLIRLFQTKKTNGKSIQDKVPYDAWERQGFITITNSEIVDQNVVMDYVLNFCKENELDIQTLCFDPANASKIMIDLSNEGYIVEEVYQSHKSLNEATEDSGKKCTWELYAICIIRF